MEDDMILNRPSGRRLVGDDNELPPGPPGTENDNFEIGRKKRKSSPQSKEKERNKSPSPRRRRSPSPRQSRNRESSSYGQDYVSPRRYGSTNRRRSRDRIRSPDHSNDRTRGRNDRRRERRSRSRERYRPRRSKSLSSSPRGRRWSPMRKKPASPPPIPQAPPYVIPANVYSDGYATYPPQYAAQQYPTGEYTTAPAAPPFATPYPPPPAWGMQVPPDDFSTHPAAWNAVPPVQPPAESEEEQLKRDAAVAQEVQNQRDQLKKQRSDYLKRAAALKRELKILKEQRNDLVSGNNPPSPTTKGFLDENDRLQNQIQKKLTTIENVVDMLSGIIGEDKPPTPPSPVKVSKKKKRNNSDDDDSSPERLKSKVIESMKTKRDIKKEVVEISHPKSKSEISKKSEEVAAGKKINYIFYDPEMHWCQICDVFPKTAKDFLNHLQSKEHSEMIKTPQTPWHDAAASDEFPTYENAQAKRTPIRGLQFFIPATSWYCKLCNTWMGDLHCASTHLKSQTHSEKYNAYIEQNPHFEVDWMAERQKSYDLQRAPPPPQITSVSTTGMDLLESIPLQINNQKGAEVDKNIKKRKKKSEDKKDKKKKKRSKKRKKSSSSSSSSSSDTSSESDTDKTKEDCQTSSIRVVMRNLFKTQGEPGDMESVKGKWTTVQEGVPPPEPIPPPPPTINPPDPEAKKRDDLMISQWSTPQPIISESEKKLLEELKGKLKSKPEDDRKRSAAVNDAVKIIDNGKNAKKPDGHANDRGRRSRSKNRKSSSPVNQTAAIASRDKRSRSRGKRSRSRDRRSKSRTRRSRSRNRNKRSRSRGAARRSRSRDRRSRSRNRRSNSRNRGGRRRRSRDARRSRSPVGRHARRRSYSRSRSRSRSRSSTHRIEKPIVRYPEFRPRVPENKKVVKVKTDEEGERKKSPVIKKSATLASATGKKLPFIGRMPVFKKQIPGTEEKKEGESVEYIQMDPSAMGYDNFENLVMMDYDDLMPDPMQYVTLMGAPPPPPGPPPDDDKDILPPGIDETETDSIPKPISDAPIPRKGPLPRDFEEALNIIFPGDNQPAASSDGKETKRTKGNDATSLLEQSTDDGAPKELPIEDRPLNFGAVYSDHSQDISDITLVPAIPPPPPPPPPEAEAGEKVAISIEKENVVKEMEEKKELSPTDSEKLRRQAELADLAMLGIDADDLAAQCM